LVLDAISLPPRMLRDALRDLHRLADGLQRLTESEADIEDLIESVHVLPRVEDELSANIALLREDVQRLQAELAPLREAVSELNSQIQAVRDRIPGI
jgi:chromosome segregation ATPase